MPVVNAIQSAYAWASASVCGAGSWLWNDTIVATWNYVAPHVIRF